MNNNPMWTPGVTLEEMEKQIIIKALAFYQGNKMRTADSLGIAIRTLRNKLALYKMGEPEADEQDTQPKSGRTKNEKLLAP